MHTTTNCWKIKIQPQVISLAERSRLSSTFPLHYAATAMLHVGEDVGRMQSLANSKYSI